MKKATVIGPTSGIGKELAIMMAGEGWHVGIVGRRTALLDEIVRQSPANFTASVLDVTDSGSVKKLEELINDMERMDLLVFSSGTGQVNPELDHALENDNNRLR